MGRAEESDESDDASAVDHTVSECEGGAARSCCDLAAFGILHCITSCSIDIYFHMFISYIVLYYIILYDIILYCIVLY